MGISMQNISSHGNLNCQSNNSFDMRTSHSVGTVYDIVDVDVFIKGAVTNKYFRVEIVNNRTSKLHLVERDATKCDERGSIGYNSIEIPLHIVRVSSFS